MQKLIHGVQRFQADVYSQYQERFEQLAEGQKPETLFITCSDSRIDPHLLTQSKPGELFIIRNAGNIVPKFDSLQGGEAATIEFAINALGVRDVIVCGHSQCGAMKGLLEPEGLGSLPTVRSWLIHAADTSARVAAKYPGVSGGELLKLTIEENVSVQLDNLRTHPAVATAVADGRIQLYGWVYEFQSGDVFALDAATNAFASIRGSDGATGSLLA